MKRQHKQKTLLQPVFATGLAGLFALSACSGEAADDTPATKPHVMSALQKRAPAPQLEADCLLPVWDGQKQPNRDFDRANDRVEGGEISCATGTSASQYEDALTAIRTAAAGEDRAAILRALDIPLLFIDAEGERREVLESDLADAGFDEVFSPEMLGLMRSLQLKDMTVVEGQGGFFALGSIWLMPRAEGERPVLVTINAQALREARQAALRNDVGVTSQ